MNWNERGRVWKRSNFRYYTEIQTGHLLNTTQRCYRLGQHAGWNDVVDRFDARRARENLSMVAEV
jgi:hypothetical protein